MLGAGIKMIMFQHNATDNGVARGEISSPSTEDERNPNGATGIVISDCEGTKRQPDIGDVGFLIGWSGHHIIHKIIDEGKSFDLHVDGIFPTAAQLMIIVKK